MKSFLKNKTVLSFFIGFSFLLFFCSCISRISSGVKNGDLIFVTAKNDGLSGAINKVTQKQENASFDHIGIVQKNSHGTYVLHAAPKGGSQKQKLIIFLKDRKSDGQKVMLYRLKPNYQQSIPTAIVQANLMLGKPYNFNYILDENAYYCSDFVERAFRKDHIFQLQPMTFIDPETGKTNAFWAEFYAKKNLKVPEGAPGCNPNGLAASDKIERIKEL